MLEFHRGRSAAIRSSACLLLVAVCAGAGATESSVPAPLRECTTIRKNSERLVCYDQTIQRLLTGDATAASTVPSREALFGVAASTSRPTTPSTEPASTDETDSVTARITGLSADAEGKRTLQLDNGQTWRQTGTETLLLKVADEVTITRGAMNSFRITTPSGRAAKVRRVR